ncbi:RICIN domain-containing protein [Streptomyces cyanogenus]|uniref:Extracellular exo-alpha-L-arabinofuranosidase n=1 Tax=Streptomyces cyanogenus TaxID=80860 RepID=A0ABX7TV86_STRCY|nr:RICIN domain-containing protein [Streptomyces cyanogenus]QTD98669.1 Extracellular exo-alpha-L-arabinofuranosidase precursor [Streptomyces cyanogenus]
MSETSGRSRTFKRPRPAPAYAFLLAGVLAGTAPGAVPANAAPASAPDSAPASATKAGPFGPSTCKQGYVWRESHPEDHVCVTPDVRTQTWNQNRANYGNTDDNGRCRDGLVFREAIPGDEICVTQSVRDAARKANEQAAMHWEATWDRVYPDGYVPFPFTDAGHEYKIRSSYTAARNGKQVLYVDVWQGSTQDGTGTVVWDYWGGANQRFVFRRAGNDLAYQNVFEIVAAHSGKCLDVFEWSKSNGARIVQWSCHGGLNQKWYLERRADNRWQIRSLYSDKCLDADQPSLQAPEHGVIVQQWDCIGGKNQAWSVVN